MGEEQISRGALYMKDLFFSLVQVLLIQNSINLIHRELIQHQFSLIHMDYREN